MATFYRLAPALFRIATSDQEHSHTEMGAYWMQAEKVVKFYIPAFLGATW